MSGSNLNEVQKFLENRTQGISGSFSVLASELSFELAAPNPDWDRVFLLQIDCFESSIAFFFSACCWQRWSVQFDLSLESSASNIQNLRNGTKLSTGHWWSLLRDTTGFAREPLELSPMAQVALSVFFEGKICPLARTTPFPKLDAIPNIRNRVKGHSFTLTPEQYAEHLHRMYW